MKRAKWTLEQINEIYSKPFDLFPPPSSEALAKGVTKRKPLDWQKLAFQWEYSWQERLVNNSLHCHSLDNLLIYSGSGTGKTATGVALNLFFLMSFPGCQTLCGANVYSDVEQIIIPKFQKLLSINEPWDHPTLRHIPNKQDKFLDLAIPTFNEKGEHVGEKISRCWLCHFADWERLRGKEYVYVHAEEISQLKEERVIDEMGRRLRSPLAPFRMLYATTNPPESMSHFLYQKWDLSKYIPGYEGDPPSPRLCKCQFCPQCLETLNQEFLYDDQEFCSNPNCAFLEICIKENLPIRRFKKPSYEFRGHTYSCPGNQSFWRVFKPKPEDNIHNPSSLNEELKAGHDSANYDVYVKGEVRALTSNKVYPSYSILNTFINEVLIDPDRDIHWTHDHNNRPRCSAILQERIGKHEDEELVYIDCIDEIVMYEIKVSKFAISKKELDELCLSYQEVGDSFIIKNAGPEHVADEFIKKYSKWNQEGINRGNQRTVYLYGDHTALYNKMGPFSANEFQIYVSKLIEAGFKVENTVKKRKGAQVTQVDRIVCTNWLLNDGNNICRLRLNKNCKHALKSFEDLEIKSGKINKACDEGAARSTNTKIVHLVSHITDAIGYYLVKKFNLIKNNQGGLKFMFVQGNPLLRIDYETGTITPEEDQEEQKSPNQENLLDLVKQYIDKGMEEENEDSEILERFRSFYSY